MKKKQFKFLCIPRIILYSEGGLFNISTHKNFNVENSIKPEENMKYCQFFFSILKTFIKNSNNIPSISKTIQHTPMTWCTYLQSFASYSAKTKRDGQTDGRTDGRTDGGRCNISRPGPSAPREIIKYQLVKE